MSWCVLVRMDMKKLDTQMSWRKQVSEVPTGDQAEDLGVTQGPGVQGRMDPMRKLPEVTVPRTVWKYSHK